MLAIVISDGMATRRRIEEVRGATQLSIGPDGPVSLLIRSVVLQGCPAAVLNWSKDAPLSLQRPVVYI